MNRIGKLDGPPIRFPEPSVPEWEPCSYCDGEGCDICLSEQDPSDDGYDWRSDL